jgi:hypothetical protein
MRIRLDVIILTSVILSLTICSRGFAQESQQTTQIQNSTPVIIESGDAADALLRENLFANLNLRKFENRDDSTCVNGDSCSELASLKCLINACDDAGSKNPVLCLEDFRGFEGDKKLANERLCNILESPSAENIKMFISTFPGDSEASVMRKMALIQALKGNSSACHDKIIEFIGSYGASWNIYWLVTMSGCRILAGESTVEAEENDFLTWHNVENIIVAKQKMCSDIVNVEMQNACNAGVKAP